MKTVANKTYRLKNGSAPLSYMIPVRDSKRYRLLYFDEEKNTNRTLRYARNMKSPFEDEQSGTPIVEPVVFEDGMLHVPAKNPVLQEFLHYHPMNGTIFEEVNYAKDAAKEVDILFLEADALILAKELGVRDLEDVYRTLSGNDPSRLSTEELRRDVLLFAKMQPREFMTLVNDPEMKYQAMIHKFFEDSYLRFRNNKKEVWVNTATNKGKVCTIPYGEDPYYVVGSYLKTNDGIDLFNFLKGLVEG